MIRTVLSRRFCNLPIRPTVLFILHSTVSRCFAKDNWLSWMIARCFWNVLCITLLLLNISGDGGMWYCFKFSTKNDCPWLFFFWIWIKLVFRWNAHLFIFAKSLFSLRAEVLISWITENKSLLSANSLAFKDNHSDKSLINIKSNNGPGIRTKPWRTPALASDQTETCPYNKTLCFLFLRKSHKRFSDLPDIPFCFNLKMRHSCQTLSNIFDISRKALHFKLFVK